MVTEIVTACAVPVATVVVALIEARAARDRKRVQANQGKLEAEQARMDARADRRAMESRLSMELMSASVELSVVTATALQVGHTNGTLQPALEKAQAAQEEYNRWLRSEAARNVAKI